MENAVDENAVFAVADEEKVRVLEHQFQVASRYETRMAHVDVDVAPRTIAADNGPFLTDVKFKFTPFESGDDLSLVHPLGRFARTGRR